MSVQLVLSATPFDEIPGKLALATFFENVRPLKGSTGLIDWRLNGRVSELILQGRIFGSFAESIIMPAQGRLAADEILLFGLGRSDKITPSRLEKGFTQVIRKLLLLKSSTFIISFGDLAQDFMGWRSVLRSFMAVLSEEGDREELQIVCAEEARWVREAKKRNMDFGPDVDLEYA